MFKLSDSGLAAVKSELARYEAKESAIIPSLYVAQKENNGFITPDIIRHLSQVMDIPEARINEVFKFYTMFNQKPVGKYHVQVCTNISCALEGGREMASHICHELGVKYNEVTADGRFTVSKVECLGSCGTAPMMQVNDTYHEKLTPETAMNLLRGMK
ncbi:MULTISPECIES: complex I 24 kDa subunit family protein [Bdellovibrio]|jgi:NADH-quinone oxidoreductase subunit E|uniref:NADH dehydrogenase I chain E n=1 Tax=Bdellovibrio bacteriovorus str. Tiberius TaxID=1069642 RepID=K7ZBW4_BDEBC|nr:NAD(P)H-dependent oxidoreductase subunit E [Bdellovibrio bacteriovorus]AFY02689.1 NADH dehydrogenase I chain E [Bdellovibrio bacteriovorus str. Tiberius]